MANCTAEIITESMNDLIESGVTTGLAVSFGKADENLSFFEGFTGDNEGQKIDKNTIIDLASVTKLFLSFAFFSINDKLNLDFKKSLGYYCGDTFPFINNVSLDDVFHFNCNFVTSKRITECPYDEAMYQLLNVRPEAHQKPIYSDIPALILGLVFKRIAGIGFGEYVEENIINKYRLSNTFWRRRGRFTENYLNYDNELIIKNGRLISFRQEPLVVNDKKAEILSDGGKRLCGNAGLFTSAEDMSVIAKAIINRDMLSDDSLKRISSGFDPEHVQRFGYLSYRKSPNKKLSEIYHKMSDSSFAISGFTGTYFTIDPINNCYVFIAGNRLNNRVTFTDDEKLLRDNVSVAFNNQTYRYTKDYVFMRDVLRDSCCEYLL